MFDTALHRGAGWQAAHEALTLLARTRAGLDFEEGGIACCRAGARPRAVGVRQLRRVHRAAVWLLTAAHVGASH